MNTADLSRSVIPSLARGAGSESLARRLFWLPKSTMPAITEVVKSQIKVDRAMETMNKTTGRIFSMAKGCFGQPLLTGCYSLADLTDHFALSEIRVPR